MRRQLAAVLLSLSVAACAEKPHELQPREGRIAVEGGHIWYRVVGSGTKTPLVLLHGGPGFPSYYLKPLLALADERPVIIYDQLGAGKSDHVTDTTLFNTARFVRELEALRDSLGVPEMYVLGHSWGTILGTEYALAHPERVKGLILASSALSIPMWLHDADSLLHTMPDSTQRTIHRLEAAHAESTAAYQGALMEYYGRYVFTKPLSADAESTFTQPSEALYNYMQGKSEWVVTGTLKGYDITPRLHELHMPVLFTAGEHDEATPTSTRAYAAMIPGAKVEIIPGSGHLTTNDNPQAMVGVVRAFLSGIENTRR
jgi:proline iminopeptidase